MHSELLLYVLFEALEPHVFFHHMVCRVHETILCGDCYHIVYNKLDGNDDLA